MGCLDVYLVTNQTGPVTTPDRLLWWSRSLRKLPSFAWWPLPCPSSSHFPAKESPPTPRKMTATFLQLFCYSTFLLNKWQSKIEKFSSPFYSWRNILRGPVLGCQGDLNPALVACLATQTPPPPPHQGGRAEVPLGAGSPGPETRGGVNNSFKVPLPLSVKW